MSGGLLGDLKGGVTAAFSAVPVELVYGLFAVAPLGAAFAEHGMRAALLGCILGGFMGFVLRGTGGMLTGTRPATGLILGALATHLLYQPAVNSASNPAELVFILLLLCTALSGLFQFLFGLAYVGRALKYIPFPVTAGLMLGVGVLMILGNLRPAFGVSHHVPWPELFNTWRPASMMVTGIVIFICFSAKRWNSPVPGSVLGLAIGSLAHHGLVYILGNERLGETSASITGLLPDYVAWNSGIEILDLLGWLPVIASYALTISALASLETLLCLSAIDDAQSSRSGGNRELRVQGLSNLLAGLLGATASAGNLSRVKINLSSGGNSRLSGISYAVTLGLIGTLAGNYLSLVPHAVTAAIVIYFAVGMADEGTRRIVQQLIAQRGQVGRQYYRLLLANFSVILLVASVAVIGDMMKAVGIGLAAAMFLFVSTRMKPVVRRVAFGDQRHSLKIRTSDDRGLLDQHGTQIAIIEADGPLFFGTADSIADEIENLSIKANLLIIDLKRVTDIDPTGARSLLQSSRRLVTKRKQLLISGASPHFENFLTSMGLEKLVPKQNWHDDLDQAMEDAENRLLLRLGGLSRHQALSLAETALVAGLNGNEIEILGGFLLKKECGPNTQLFSIGDEGDSLFVAVGSSVDILIPLKDGRQRRIVGLAPGVIFGEMALLEGKRRSTTAVVLDRSIVFELSRSALDGLLHHNSGIARQVLFNVGCQLAGRLRAITGEVLLLEDS